MKNDLLNRINEYLNKLQEEDQSAKAPAESQKPEQQQEVKQEQTPATTETPTSEGKQEPAQQQVATPEAEQKQAQPTAEAPTQQEQTPATTEAQPQPAPVAEAPAPSFDTNAQLAELFTEPLASKIKNATKPVANINGTSLIFADGTMQESLYKSAIVRFREVSTEQVKKALTSPEGTDSENLMKVLSPTIRDYLKDNNIKFTSASNIAGEGKAGKTIVLSDGKNQIPLDKVEADAKAYKTEKETFLEKARESNKVLANLMNEKVMPIVASFTKGKIVEIKNDEDVSNIFYVSIPVRDAAGSYKTEQEETIKLPPINNQLFSQKVQNYLVKLGDKGVIDRIGCDANLNLLFLTKDGSGSYTLDVIKNGAEGASSGANEADSFGGVNTLSKEEATRALPILEKDLNEFIQKNIKTDAFKEYFKDLKGNESEITVLVQTGGMRELKESSDIISKIQRFIEEDEKKTPEQKLSQEVQMRIIINPSSKPSNNPTGEAKDKDKKTLEDFKKYLLEVRNKFIEEKKGELTSWKDEKVKIGGVAAEVKISIGPGADKNTVAKETEKGLEGDISFTLSKGLKERKVAGVLNKIGNALGTAASVAAGTFNPKSSVTATSI